MLAQVILASECLVIEKPVPAVTNISTSPLQPNLVKSFQSIEQANKSSFPTPITEQGQSKTEKSTQLQKLIQQLYLAQAQVQLEANEIGRAQAVAATGQKDLEEATNNVRSNNIILSTNNENFKLQVRIITSGLHLAQQAVAQAALRAQTAQLQLAAHDQLLFTARQKVDALSAQMVGLQAEVGIESETHLAVNLKELLQKLREPLSDKEKPTPIPTLINVEQPMNTDLEQNKPPMVTDRSKLPQKRDIFIENPFINEYQYDYDPVYDNYLSDDDK